MSGLSGIGVFWAFTSFLSSVIICVGYFMPYWISGQISLQDPDRTHETVPVFFGIFRRCNYPAMKEDQRLTMVLECGRYTTFHDIPSVSWKIATLTIGFGCGLCLVVSLIAMFGICLRGVVMPSVARSSGIIQLCSGILMGAGVGIYPNGWDTPEVTQACGSTSKAYSLGDCSLGWCFYVISVGILMTLLCSGLAFHAPKRKHIVQGYAV